MIKVEPNAGFEAELNKYYEEHIVNNNDEKDIIENENPKENEENNMNEIKEK